MEASRARLAVVLGTATVLALAALGVAGKAHSTSGCFQANGHLYVSAADPGASRMIGKINGDYAYTFQASCRPRTTPR